MKKTAPKAADPAASSISRQLQQLITDTIRHAGGAISFADYMQLCLYQPGLGYYSAGSKKFGSQGDFITAPEISPLFAAALAQHTADALSQLSQADILEFGAGSGRLAVDLLRSLQQLQQLPSAYYILETSAELRQRQQQTVHTELPALASRIHWLDRLPEQFCGVIIANEVCDAMPVHRLQFQQQQCLELAVGIGADGFCWQQQPLSAELQAKAVHIADLIGLQDHYLTEINLHAEAWLSSLAERLQQGVMFIIDYGYPASEYYLPQRQQGSLRCYYQHQAHDNPFLLPGLQDITAHVDFSALAEAAFVAGLQVSGFQQQNDFLLAGDITLFAEQLLADSDDIQRLQHSAALKRLLLPGQMGDSFKVLSLCRELELPRLAYGDRRHQL